MPHQPGVSVLRCHRPRGTLVLSVAQERGSHVGELLRWIPPAVLQRLLDGLGSEARYVALPRCGTAEVFKGLGQHPAQVVVRVPTGDNQVRLDGQCVPRLADGSKERGVRRRVGHQIHDGPAVGDYHDPVSVRTFVEQVVYAVAVSAHLVHGPQHGGWGHRIGAPGGVRHVEAHVVYHPVHHSIPRGDHEAKQPAGTLRLLDRVNLLDGHMPLGQKRPAPHQQRIDSGGGQHGPRRQLLQRSGRDSRKLRESSARTEQGKKSALPGRQRLLNLAVRDSPGPQATDRAARRSASRGAIQAVGQRCERGARVCQRRLADPWRRPERHSQTSGR